MLCRWESSLQESEIVGFSASNEQAAPWLGRSTAVRRQEAVVSVSLPPPHTECLRCVCLHEARPIRRQPVALSRRLHLRGTASAASGAVGAEVWEPGDERRRRCAGGGAPHREQAEARLGPEARRADFDGRRRLLDVAPAVPVCWE